jgi:hypothetical protein
MRPAALLPLLAIAACAPAPPLVSTRDTPQPAALFAVAGDTPAASEVRRQLQARDRYAADAAASIRTGFAAAPRRTGTCVATSANTSDCADWLDTPQTGFAPFAPPLRYRLTLAVTGGQVIVTKAGGEQDQPLPAMVSVALDRLLAGSTEPGQP